MKSAVSSSTPLSRNGANLTLLIDDILDLSKVEAEKMEFERIPVDAAAVLEEVCTSLGIMATGKGITLDTEWAADLNRVILSDPARIRQVLTNIIGNAVKFTAKGGVSVKVFAATQETLRFEVTDTGRGIAKSVRDSLFRPFSQGDSSTTRRYGGTGLGLVLSKQLARGLGGDVQLQDSEIGRGSIFCITIKAKPATLPASKAMKSDLERTKLQGLRVLIADDSPDNRLLLRRILSRQGVIVAEVENGMEAVRCAHEYEIVLMDIQMPVLDGYYATARLRSQGYRGAIIALTAHAMKEERDRCLAIGCNEYLTKPIDVPQLLQSLLRNRRSVPATEL